MTHAQPSYLKRKYIVANYKYKYILEKIYYFLEKLNIWKQSEFGNSNSQVHFSFYIKGNT